MKSADEKLNVQSLVDHLSDLRTRLVWSALFIAIGAILCWIKSDLLFDWIRHPVAPYLPQGGLVYTGVTDKFMAHLRVALSFGVILSCPLWLYQVWLFLAPGLYKKEQKYAISFLFSGTFLFLTGVAFAYYVVFPFAFEFLMSFGGDVDKPMITIGEYLSFFTSTTLMFGAVFEMPLVFCLLAIMGIIEKSFLTKNRRYAVVALSVVAAVITPPDLMSMLLLLGPLLLLYEISILLVGILQKRRVQ